MIMKRAPVSCGSLNGLEINRSLPHETRILHISLCFLKIIQVKPGTGMRFQGLLVTAWLMLSQDHYKDSQACRNP